MNVLRILKEYLLTYNKVESNIMRTIRFRGKRIKDGKWICGNLANYSFNFHSLNINKTVIFKNIASFETDNFGFVVDDCEVANETVGQFTGLLDRNGKEIYEGDIVQLDYITTAGKHRIGLSFEVKWCAKEGCWVGWDGFVENTIQQTCKMFVVKGNIYDNPELINE